MPSSHRKGAWHFETQWTFAGQRPISTEITSIFLHEFDTVLKSDLLDSNALPRYMQGTTLKYKLSDLEAALSKTPMTIQVTGYIQSDPHHAVGSDTLLQ